MLLKIFEAIFPFFEKFRLLISGIEGTLSLALPFMQSLQIKFQKINGQDASSCNQATVEVFYEALDKLKDCEDSFKQNSFLILAA
jgi:hypothetical protein